MNNNSADRDSQTAQICNQINWLSQPGNLEQRLRNLDNERRTKRIFLMGCGRSGTWLLTAAMREFIDLAVVPRELSVEHFGVISTQRLSLLLKRDCELYQRVEDIPQCVSILHIIRHPYDVLTSYNRTNPKFRYHIAPHRWIGEMLALQYLLDTKRPNTKLVRYEDLVFNPDMTLADIGTFFNLKLAASSGIKVEFFNAPPEAIAAMNGVRPIDRKSVNRYKNRVEYIEHIRTIRPRLGRTLDWVEQTFQYDITIPLQNI